MVSEKFATFEAFRAHCLQHAKDIYVRTKRGQLFGSYGLSELSEEDRDMWIRQWWEERTKPQGTT
jgi:hypothetical protein